MYVYIRPFVPTYYTHSPFHGIYAFIYVCVCIYMQQWKYPHESLPGEERPEVDKRRVTDLDKFWRNSHNTACSIAVLYGLYNLHLAFQMLVQYVQEAANETPSLKYHHLLQSSYWCIKLWKITSSRCAISVHWEYISKFSTYELKLTTFLRRLQPRVDKAY